MIRRPGWLAAAAVLLLTALSVQNDNGGPAALRRSIGRGLQASVVLHCVNTTCPEDGTFSCPVALSEKSSWQLVVEWLLVLVLVVMSGLFSGLTLGLMGLDLQGLDIVIDGNPESLEARYARSIRPIREQGNLLLCTLLLGNVMVNAALSILLADKTDGILGFIISTAVIVIFGEIGPQAVCSRHALKIGAHTVWIVFIFKWILYPLTKPIAMALDFMLGQELRTVYGKGELTKLLQIHAKEGAIDNEQEKMMAGAISYQDKLVSSSMTPIEKVFMLNVDSLLDFKTMSSIFKSGFSRIPVYGRDRNTIVGMLLTKDLIVVDPEESTTVKAMLQFFGRNVELLYPDQKLGEALALFKSGRTHLAIVHDVNNESDDRDPFYEVKGLLTLEDIIEEILGDEIVDETDVYVEMEKEDSRVNRESFDYARLRLLDSRHGNELSEDECNAVTAHLVRWIARTAAHVRHETRLSLHRAIHCVTQATNVQYFADAIANGVMLRSDIRDMVRQIPVLELKGPEYTKDGAKKSSVPRPSFDGVLYRRDKPEMYCTLILSGKMRILAGREAFASEGTDALGCEEGAYIADFTASVLASRALRLAGRVLLRQLGDLVRCLRFSHKDFLETVSRSKKRTSSASSKDGKKTLAAPLSIDVMK